MHDHSTAIEGTIVQWMGVGVATCAFGTLVHLNVDNVCGVVLMFIGLALMAVAGIDVLLPRQADLRQLVLYARIVLVAGVVGVGVWAGVDMIINTQKMS